MHGASMGHKFAQTIFSSAAKALQKRYGSRAAYERIAQSGVSHDSLSANEIDFIRERDSFYMASVTADGWPYIQHRGGPAGFLKVLGPKALAFADFSGNRQYISAGNLTENDRVSLFLMDYPHRTRLKILGHAHLIEPGSEPELDQLVAEPDYDTEIERIFRIELVAYDWNCPQHITPRFTLEEIALAMPKSSR
jgi:uncharacterized protein